MAQPRLDRAKQRRLRARDVRAAEIYDEERAHRLRLRRMAEEVSGLETDLARFVRAAWPIIEPGTPYLHNWHIDCICDYLMAVTAGELTRVVFNLPPRYMKSTLISILWPAWEWIRYPEYRWLFVSHAATLSTDHSVSRRVVIQSDWYQDRWKHVYQLTGDQNVKNSYTNTRRGKMVAGSIGGAVMGKGGRRLVIDDPLDSDQADSDTEREFANRFYDQTLYSRQDDKRKSAIILVMQRLHKHDLTGHVLEDHADEDWTVVKFPGESKSRTVVSSPRGRSWRRDEGELLWPEREGPDEIRKARIALGPYGYSGQYDQEPVTPGGEMFKSGWFAGKFVGALPSNVIMIRYWDKASTEGGGAFSAGAKLARDMQDRYYIANVHRGQWSPNGRESNIKLTAELDGYGCDVWVEEEGGSSGKDSSAITIKGLAGYVVRADHVTGSKVTRARALASHCEAGNVYIVKTGDPARDAWIRPFLDELESFPLGKYLDQIDAASGAFNKLALDSWNGSAHAGGDLESLRGFMIH